MAGIHRAQSNARHHLHRGTTSGKSQNQGSPAPNPKMMGPNPHTISVLALASIWSHQPCLAPLQKLRFATKDMSHSIPQKGAVSLAKKANEDHQLGPLLSQPPARLPNTQYLPIYFLQLSLDASFSSTNPCQAFPKLSKARPLTTCKCHDKGMGS